MEPTDLNLDTFACYPSPRHLAHFPSPSPFRLTPDVVDPANTCIEPVIQRYPSYVSVGVGVGSSEMRNGYVIRSYQRGIARCSASTTFSSTICKYVICF